MSNRNLALFLLGLTLAAIKPIWPIGIAIMILAGYKNRKENEDA
ncbi:hypothetical protein [Holdemania massiliensis]|nr:hypothetical protein [Holdemania massiliensis]